MSGLAVLAIDTAGPVVGAALLKPDGTVSSWSERVVRGADARLGPALQRLLTDTERLDLVVVSHGPGAFTSLRVGVACALGVAMSRGCPVLGVCSLEARALAARSALADQRPVLAMLDGRKGRAYAALLTESPGQAHDVPPEQALALASGDFVATGEGAVVWSEMVVAAGGQVLEGADASPAPALARLGAERFDQAGPPETLRLRYLRAADAKLPKARARG